MQPELSIKNKSVATLRSTSFHSRLFSRFNFVVSLEQYASRFNCYSWVSPAFYLKPLNSMIDN